MQSANKMCVALLFGGMSSEHEVSRVSVGNFVRNIDREQIRGAHRGHHQGGPLALHRGHGRADGRRQLGRAARQYALRDQPGPRRPRHDPVHPGRPGGKDAP